MAFEVARALQAQGRPGPEHLFLSAEPAPSAGWQRPVWHDLPEDEFRERVISLGGIHPEVVGHKDAMSVLLTTVRADFRLWEPHRPAPGPRLDAPITVVAGASDARTPLDTLDGWAQETTGPFETRVYPGDHFYFLEDPEALVRYLGEVMLSSQPLGRPA
jgi:medium-chain acyl-[acyl-carrier-protein] hydrolase